MPAVPGFKIDFPVIHRCQPWQCAIVEAVAQTGMFEIKRVALFAWVSLMLERRENVLSREQAVVPLDRTHRIPGGGRQGGDGAVIEDFAGTHG